MKTNLARPTINLEILKQNKKPKKDLIVLIVLLA
jgi:hypothetical protein